MVIFCWRYVLTNLKLRPVILLIVSYVVLVSMGSAISLRVDINYFGQVLLLLAFSVFLLFYLRGQKLAKVVGLTTIGVSDCKQSLFYFPLVFIVLANGVFFFDKTIVLQDMLLSTAFMFFAAFLEELLFRGLLFKAIEKMSTTKSAILVSGATFGFGHILNLFNGYTGISQILQIALAVLIGVVLSVLFVRTKSIVPGIIFHFVFNTASALSKTAAPMYDYISVGIILLIGAVYLVYLIRDDKMKFDTKKCLEE